MAPEFVGLTVLVKLREPSTTLRGLVAAVHNGRLHLKNVVFQNTTSRLNDYMVSGGEILDIEVLQNDEEDEKISTPTNEMIQPLEIITSALSRPSPPPSSFPTHFATLRPAQVLPQKSFVDPAILSFTRRPSKDNSRPAVAATATTSAPILTATTVPTAPYPETPTASSPYPETSAVSAPYPTGLGPQLLPDIPRESTPAYPAKKTFDYLILDKDTHLADQEEVVVTAENFSSRPASRNSVNQQESKPHKRRRQRPAAKKREIIAAATATATDDPDDSSPQLGRAYPRNMTDSNGWRRTPILQSPSERQNHQTQKETRKQKRLDREAQKNGWATEDPTDIQELGDFDFVANLKQFDKQAVFEQLRDADTTLDEDRLVSFNRNTEARPGTFGGRNLHPTEMVLSPVEIAAPMPLPLPQPQPGRGFQDGPTGRSSVVMPALPSGSSDDEPGDANGNGSLSSSRMLPRGLRHTTSRGSSRMQQHHHHHHQHQHQQPSSRKSSASIPVPLPIPITGLDHANFPHRRSSQALSLSSPTMTQQLQSQSQPQPPQPSYLPYPYASDEQQQQQQQQQELQQQLQLQQFAPRQYHHHHYNHSHNHNHSRSHSHSHSENSLSRITSSAQQQHHVAMPAEPGQDWLLNETLDRLEKMALQQMRTAEDMLRLVAGVREGVAMRGD